MITKDGRSGMPNAEMGPLNAEKRKRREARGERREKRARQGVRHGGRRGRRRHAWRQDWRRTNQMDAWPAKEDKARDKG